MNSKEKLIEMFLEVVEQNEEFKQYIDVEQAREILNANIEAVLENAEMEVGNFLAVYEVFDKTISLSKSVDINNLTNRIKITCVHEVLHALTRNMELDEKKIGEGFSGINYFNQYETTNMFRKAELDWYDTGRGLNEGITEWLAEKLVGEKIKAEGLCVCNIMGIRNQEGASYPLEQILVKELIILYGEETIIKAYLNNDVSIIKGAIEKNTQSEKAGDKFDEFSDLADSLVEMDMSALGNIGSKDFRKEYREVFSKTQDFFTEEFLTKEIEIALESQDMAKIEEVKGKIEKLLELNIDVKGKGNPFNDIAEKFNEQIQSMGIESQIPIKKETLFDKLKKSFSKSEMMNKGLYFFEAYHKVKRMIKKYTKKNEMKAMPKPASLKPIKAKAISSDKELIEKIRGLPEEEYEVASKKAEKDWESTKEKDSDKSERQTSCLEK